MYFVFGISKGNLTVDSLVVICTRTMEPTCGWNQKLTEDFKVVGAKARGAVGLQDPDLLGDDAVSLVHGPLGLDVNLRGRDLDELGLDVGHVRVAAAHQVGPERLDGRAARNVPNGSAVMTASSS